MFYGVLTLSNIRFPMIITCMIKNPQKIRQIFDKLLRDSGYVKIGENAYVHQAGEQLTAAISSGRTYLPEVDAVKECLTLFLSATTLDTPFQRMSLLYPAPAGAVRSLDKYLL